MHIMTYNIWDGGAERVSLIAEVIASSNPDVVLLNEADDERIVEQLARTLSYEPLWARGSGDKHIALLTRLPVVEWRVYNQRPLTQAVLAVKLQIRIPDPAKRGARSARRGHNPKSQNPTIQLPNYPTIRLFGVHLLPYFMLLPYEFARWRTVRALLRLVQQTARGPHLIFGDCNAALAGERADTRIFSKKIQRQLWLQGRWQPRFALAQITRAGYVDCFRHLHPDEAGLTWMPWALSARLDYIFADAEMASRLRACEVISAPPAAQASDHFPLVAEFEIGE